MISYQFLLLQHFSNHKHLYIIESDELITTLMKIFLHNIFSLEIKLLEPQFLNPINTYHIQFGARTIYTQSIIHTGFLEALLTGSKLFIASLTRWRWTKILRWRQTLITYDLSASGKVWQISLTTDHNCLSFIFIFVLSVPILEDMFKLNLFRLRLSVLTEIRNYKSTSFQDLQISYSWVTLSATTLSGGPPGPG